MTARNYVVWSSEASADEFTVHSGGKEILYYNNGDIKLAEGYVLNDEAVIAAMRALADRLEEIQEVGGPMTGGAMDERLVRRTDPGSLGAVAVCRLDSERFLSVGRDFGMGWTFKEGGPWKTIDEAVDAYVESSDLPIERTVDRKRRPNRPQSTPRPTSEEAP